jgi:hypothetical protein
MFQSMKLYGEGGSMHPFILNFCTRWKWAVNFRPRPIYSQEIQWYVGNRRVVGLQSQVGLF